MVFQDRHDLNSVRDTFPSITALSFRVTLSLHAIMHSNTFIDDVALTATPDFLAFDDDDFEEGEDFEDDFDFEDDDFDEDDFDDDDFDEDFDEDDDF